MVCSKCALVALLDSKAKACMPRRKRAYASGMFENLHSYCIATRRCNHSLWHSRPPRSCTHAPIASSSVVLFVCLESSISHRGDILQATRAEARKVIHAMAGERPVVANACEPGRVLADALKTPLWRRKEVLRPATDRGQRAVANP